MGTTNPDRFPPFAWRITASHVVTYFVAGLLAYTVFDYQSFFTEAPLAGFMRPVNSKWVAAGPALQLIRGVVLAFVLYPFRTVFLNGRRGWWTMWMLVAGLAVVCPSGPAPGSLEGFIYTTLRAVQHLRGLPEALLQTLAFCLLFTTWSAHPSRLWTRAMAAGVVVVVALSTLALLLPGS